MWIHMCLSILLQCVVSDDDADEQNVHAEWNRALLLMVQDTAVTAVKGYSYAVMSVHMRIFVLAESAL